MRVQSADRQALGSPDPDGRQIDGLGGGASSLSKVCIIGQPGEALHEQEQNGRLPGVVWADDAARASAYDVVYRCATVLCWSTLRGTPRASSVSR